MKVTLEGVTFGIFLTSIPHMIPKKKEEKKKKEEEYMEKRYHQAY